MQVTEYANIFFLVNYVAQNENRNTINALLLAKDEGERDIYEIWNVLFISFCEK
jgi:hypothetical protein